MHVLFFLFLLVHRLTELTVLCFRDVDVRGGDYGVG